MIKIAIEKVKVYLESFGIEQRIREFDVSITIELTISELERFSAVLAI